jgi:hypothetical protein
VTEQAENRPVPKDVWNMLLDFATEVCTFGTDAPLIASHRTIVPGLELNLRRQSNPNHPTGFLVSVSHVGILHGGLTFAWLA